MVTVEETDGLLEMSIWQRAISSPMTLRERLRWCKKILTTGVPWSDWVMLGPENAARLRDILTEYIRRKDG